MVNPAIMPVPPEGLLIELVTPLTAAGALDEASLRRLVNHIAPYAAGIVAGGPGIGEALALNTEVRQRLFSCLRQQWHGPLLFGITAHSWEETFSLCRKLEGGCQVEQNEHPLYWVDLPLWYHSNRGLPQLYKQFLAKINRPVVLLNQPDLIRKRARPWKHLNLRTAVLKKLTTLTGIAGMIYHGDMTRFLNYHRATASRPDFAFYVGDELQFLTHPGSRGVVSAGAQLLPAAWQTITEVCLHPEESSELSPARQQAWEHSPRLWQMAQLYQAAPAALVKAALHALGVLDTDTVSPTTPPGDGARRREILDLLTKFTG